MFLTNGTGRYPTSEIKLFDSFSQHPSHENEGLLEGHTSSPEKMLTCL